MGTLIDIRRLTRRFGPFTAVDDVTLTVERGEVLGFLGPNGAGKSTTMKMVTGFLAPTSGTAHVAGHDIVQEPLAAKRRLGYLPEGAPAYPDMTPEGFLNFVAAVRGLRGRERRRRIDEVVALVHLESVMRQPIETLSKGFKRRVGLAQAILHDPDVLIMDEPTDGLDPNQKHEVRDLIRAMAPRKAIILSTHILEEVDAVCTRAVIINRGRLVADGTPEQLQARSRRHNAVTLTVRCPAGGPGTIRAELARLAGVQSVEDQGHAAANGRATFTILPRNGASLVAEIADHARARNWQIDELRVEPGRLDDVFRAITTSDTEMGPMAQEPSAT